MPTTRGARPKINVVTKSIAPKRNGVKRKTPRTRKPQDMSLEDWQVALRREFGREQTFKIKNLGDDPMFSRFAVSNPQSGGTYQVTIRGLHRGDNYCTCPDFAVNTLGTCKHVEFALGRLERKRGGRAALAKGFQPDESHVYLRYDAMRQVMFQPGAACPPRVHKLAVQYFDADGKLKAGAFDRFGAFLKQANSNGHRVHCQDDVLDFVAQVRDRSAVKRRVQKAFPQGKDSTALNKLLKLPLYDYQRQGALFAAQAGRSLIADDMGLGKTMQAIAAAQILAKHGAVERVLIVCPTSLKHQWHQEIEKFTDRNAMVVEGLLARRTELYRQDAFFKITNYDVVHRDLDLIQNWAPDLIVLDEAQRIKNWKTRTAQSVKKLASPYAIVLTGTPLENRLEELHSIVEFVDRYRLGPSFRFLHEHQHVDETGRVIGYHNLSRIAKTLEPILIRRTKQQVLKQLPDRLDKRFFVPMTPQQNDHHEENREIVAKIVHKWRRYGYLSDADQRRLMIALQNMRMSCNSTYLLDQTTDFGVKTDEAMSLLSEVLEDPDAKVVIFSQWVRTHELLIRRLNDRDWKHVFFHGGVPGPKRKDLIKRFKQDPQCRLFLSTDAGGVGLNLQNASVVIIMDQPWNPAVLEQRIGRVHRLGQHRPVRVVHFIAQGTIEHGMLSLLKFKKGVFGGVLDGGKDEVFLGATRLKRFMESVEKATGDIPETMPQQTDTPTPQADEPQSDTEPQARTAGKPAEQAWAQVASAGLVLVEKLTHAVKAQSSSKPNGSSLSQLISRDEKTGQPYLKLPVPDQDTIAKIVDVLGALAGAK